MRHWIALLLIVPHTCRVNASYYRGAEPNRQDYEGLASLGIRTVIDLKQDGIAAEAAVVQRLGMRFESIPMSSTSAPSEQVVGQFLKIVSDPAGGALKDRGALKDFVFNYARRHKPLIP
jgi:hypothetical protein